MKNKNNVIIKLKILLVVGVLGLSVPFTVGADTNTTGPYQENDIVVTRGDALGVEFSVTLGSYSTETIQAGGSSFTTLNLPESGKTADYGKVELPTLSFYIAIPQKATPNMQYTVIGTRIVDGYKLYPSQPPKPETGGFDDPPFTIDNDFYASNEYYPSSVVEMSQIMNLRGCRLVRISVFPFAYNPLTESLKVFEDVQVRVDFNGGNGVFIPERYRSVYFQPLYDAFLLNSNCVERGTISNPTIPTGKLSEGERADLLIVVYDNFYEEILPLAEWRHASGLETKVVKWSEIGTTAANLRTYMQNAYDTWELPPSFLLIVGDADHVPVNYLYPHPYHGTNTGTDLWYVAFGTADYLPDIHQGRISVDNENELTIVVNKILDYSKEPYMDDNWFDDILLAAKQESGRYFVWGSETIYNYLAPLGYNCNRQYEGTTPPGSTQGVIDAINGGVIIANHRDHGASQNDGYSYTGWSGPQFTTTNILSNLNNGEKYPVMFSLNCDSGWFDGETDTHTTYNYESIGEVGLRLENKGFVAVIASTRVSYSGYNDEFCRGLYDGMFPGFDPNYPNGGSANPYNTAVYKISQVMNYGKFWMYDKYIVPGGCSPYPWTPSESVSRATFEEFHVHGDPTMDIWTMFPQSLTVAHPDVVPFGPSQVEVTVMSGGNPVEGAMVCLSQEDGMYVKGLTNQSGITTFNIEPVNLNNLSIVVTAHNYLYYQNAISIYASEPPSTPEAPDGPNSGSVSVEYTFTTTSIDPEGNQILYMFDWGDGNSSGWIGPFNSGEVGGASHSWTQTGTYEIKAKARDVLGARSNWSEPTTVYIGVPLLNLRAITGGFGSLHIDVDNIGIVDASSILWNVSIKRQMYSYSAGYVKDFNGTIETLLAGDSTRLNCRFLYGFGGLKATVRVYDVEKTVNGFVVGVFVIIFPE
ncbi:MAG: hypothetical protein IMZ43_06020 [Thermoplasmata archaeon]|nr:hypothetical protein [Thermoplasmata archaeon]